MKLEAGNSITIFFYHVLQNYKVEWKKKKFFKWHSLVYNCTFISVKEKLNEDADSEIATTSLRVSLACPLGKMRMSTPCRSSTCSHLQCFDASLFLQMNERKPTWNCPVCDKPALYDHLVIDGYFQEVLLSNKLLPDVNEIQLLQDGSWENLVSKKERDKEKSDKSDSKARAKIDVDTVDLGKVYQLKNLSFLLNTFVDIKYNNRFLFLIQMNQTLLFRHQKRRALQ